MGSKYGQIISHLGGIMIGLVTMGVNLAPVSHEVLTGIGRRFENSSRIFHHTPEIKDIKSWP